MDQTRELMGFKTRLWEELALGDMGPGTHDRLERLYEDIGEALRKTMAEEAGDPGGKEVMI